MAHQHTYVSVTGYFMWTFITILTIAFWSNSLDNTSFEKTQFLLHSEVTRCRTEKDQLTNKIIYSTVDKEAINEGGQAALLRAFGKISLDSISDDPDTRFIIAFVVQPDGQITGERIIKDKTGNVGKQMIKMAKSFKWTPAECGGRKVPMLVKLPFQICLQ